ncbi:elongation factor P 5-aminopentanone reductase [Vagococcus sp. JNUCC 83]
MPYVLVTGASGDIGEACVRDLAKKGFSVYCHYFSNEKKIHTMINELMIDYPKQDFFAIQADLSQSNSTTNLVNSLFELNAIVFAHGQTTYKLLIETSENDLQLLWHTHVHQPIRICQLCQSKLTKQETSHIVFISSVYGLIGSSMEVMYSTVKGAQLSFVKAYAKEVASMNLSVNAIAPGAIDTQMNSSWTIEEKKDLMADIPMNRLAMPKEVSSLVSYLLSDDATYITGATIPISGGWMI